MKNCIKNWPVIDIALLKYCMNDESFNKEYEYFLDVHGDLGQAFIYDKANWQDIDKITKKLIKKYPVLVENLINKEDII